MIKHIKNTVLYFKAALFLGCFFILGCENDPKVIEQWTRNKVMVEEVKNVESYFSQSGHMRALLRAPLMLRYQADTIYVEFPKTLRIDFFDSTGRTDSHLESMYGKYYETLNKVFLRDSVVAYNTQGDTLRCPEMWWDQNLQKYYTEKNVYIRKGGHTIYGKGMDASQDLTNINIRKVTGRVMVPDSLGVQ